jgi:radical S-adenosyl methionine domain-containing protein 2
MEKELISTVNFHLTRACNMKCQYCFAGFKRVCSQLDIVSQKEIIKQLYNFGFAKINFVGGEPLLVNNLHELVRYAKELGFYTSVVTNGSLLTDNFLRKTHLYLDMIGLSIDSLNMNVNKAIGRTTGTFTPEKEHYFHLCRRIKKYGIALKINTVVSKYNLTEDFTEFITQIMPLRWKILQVLEVKGENSIEDSRITSGEFDVFISRHQSVEEYMIGEGNETMRSSYIMINPEGHFYDNSLGSYTISERIDKVGVEKALNMIHFDYPKFLKRDGNYYKFLTINDLVS